MQELTVGIEIEARSKPTHVGGVPQEPCWIHFPGSEAHPEFNRSVYAQNELTLLTLEVAQSRKPSKANHAKLELITPRNCTEGHELFEKSTNNILFVLHLLYYFVATPLSHGVTTIRLNRRNYYRTLSDFVAFYNDYVRDTGVADTLHPVLRKTPAFRLIGLRFTPNDASEPLVPRFAPQLTFSGPLERIPALFNAEPGTFSEPFRDLSLRYTPGMLERRSAALGKNFVDQTIKPERHTPPHAARKAQKLHGFLTLVVYQVLEYMWRREINQGDARTLRGLSKDDFRYLLKSNLQSLRQKGLSTADKVELNKAFSTKLELVNAIRSACWVDITTDPVFTGLDRAEKARMEREIDSELVTNYLEATFIDGKDYVAAISKLVDVYTLPPPPQESEVTRERGVHLDRPLLEYRRLIDDHPDRDKYFSSAADVASAITELYDKLRFLESDVNPGRAAVGDSSSKAYYRPLARLTPRSGEVTGLPHLSLTPPQGDTEIEHWWGTRSSNG